MTACLSRPFAALLAVMVLIAPASARADDPTPKTLAVLPFEIKDTSGEALPPEQRAAMLAALAELVRQEVEAAGLYSAVPGPATDAAVAEANLHTWLRSCNGCERRIARSLGADHVMVGWVTKISRLVLSLVVRINEVETGHEVYLKAFDFRGDTEAAWAHAGRYMVRALGQTMDRQRSTAPKPDVEG